jgi:hypothetical protein
VPVSRVFLLLIFHLTQRESSQVPIETTPPLNLNTCRWS